MSTVDAAYAELVRSFAFGEAKAYRGKQLG